ncbi:uncharacterized protein VDAG_09125 [Verticillium dahliae VdLs.17]|uniref:Uncharacterized protein n=1 Tax=Verticillium dahliae (strain VdLs.17 / ATCC MYA-4575 / FGSC 10137) TaxID=498257 RepID=G2XFK1_VERDV|nr:uncharacterized protein VDAG_09125 [Verticillium dahliae VdLs.17]EGY18599.1 hypothetical protein VDAG_09125 [Verticillium dahliae VdLs.17]
MARTSLKYLSRQIEAEKSLKHLGTVSVSLDALSFPQSGGNISSELRCALIDEYTNEKKPDDGEFYYKIRELQGRFGTKNLYFEMRWWARLASSSESTNKKERLQQLYNHPQFAPAFDSFQNIPALQLLLHCLEDMRNFYDHVFEKKESAMRRLTREDVEAIQLSAPGASAEDADRLRGRIKGGMIFKAFTDQERESIWINLCEATKDCLTPSLFGFFENLKYLQGPSDCMKLIVRPRRRETIQSALEEVFSEPLPPAVGCPVQTSNASFKIAHPCVSDQLDIMYRQLWLFALREYRDMPKQSKRKLAGVKEGEVDSTVLFSFASVAEGFGFRTEQTQELRRRNPDQEMILRFLRTIRKPDQYNFESLDDSVAQVIHVISKAEPLPQHGVMELDVDNVAVALPTRCGVLNDLDQRRDKSSMFLHKLHKPIALQGTSLTSFFIQRSIYFSFFGKTINIDISNLQEFPESHPWNQFPLAQRQPLRSLEVDHTNDPDCLQPMAVTEASNVMSNWEERCQKAEENAHAAENRLLNLAKEEEETNLRLNRLKEQEEKLSERTRELEQLQHSLDEGIRANRLADSNAINAEAAEQREVSELAENETSLQNRLNELTRRENDKISSLERLEEEKKRLQAALKDLDYSVGSLRTQEQDLKSQTEQSTKNEDQNLAKASHEEAQKQSDITSILHWCAMKVSIAAAKLLWRRLLVRGGHGDGVEVVSEVAVPGQASQTGQCEGLTPQSG